MLLLSFLVLLLGLLALPLLYLLPVRTRLFTSRLSTRARSQAYTRSQAYALSPSRRFSLAEGEDDPPSDDDDEALLAHLKQAAKTDPKLQKALDLAIQRRLAKADRGGFRNDPTIERELEDLRKYRSQQEREAHEAKGKYDLALKSVTDEFGQKEKSWQQRESELMAEIQRDRVTNRLVLAATEAKALDPEDVASLLATRVKLDEKTRQPVVVDEQGQPMFKSGRPVTVKELISWHRQQKPWLYGADQQGQGGDGGGSGAGGSGAGDGDGSGGGGLTAMEKDVAEAYKVYEAAHTKAASSGSEVDISESVKARRAYEKLKKELEEAKAKARR